MLNMTEKQCMSHVQHNKRRYRRYNVTALGQIRSISGNDWTRVQVVTLSTNGACAVVGPTKFTSEIVEFKMASATTQRPSYHLMAKIVWAAGDKIGLEFISG